MRAARIRALVLAVAFLAPADGAAQRYLEPGRAPGVGTPRPQASPGAVRIPEIPSPAVASDGGEAAKTGTLPVLVLLARFANSSEQVPITAAAVEDLLFTGAGPTLPAYFEEQSGGVFTVEGQVMPWIPTEVTRADAAGSSNGHGWYGEELHAYVRQALAAADEDVDFGQFDNDGPDGVPNSGDDDGAVDALAIRFAEVAGNCGGPGPWPHLGTPFADGSAYETGDPAAGGGSITIPTYVMESVVDCDGEPQPIGPLAHQIGHLLGLPDYQAVATGLEADRRHYAVGCFDLMGTGGWRCGDGPPGAADDGPAGLSAFSRWRLGWSDLHDVTAATDTTIELTPLTAGGDGVRVWLAPESQEAWIMEYRRREGFDAALPAEGVLIYHYDGHDGPRALDPSLPPPYPFHLVEADGDDALRTVATDGGNRGEAGDVFTSGAGPLDGASSPSTRDHLGGWSTLAVHEIQVAGATAAIRLTVGEGFRIHDRSVPAAPEVLTELRAHVAFAGGEAPLAVVDQEGSVPEGLELAIAADTLLIQGAPQVAGTFPLTVWVTDGTGRRVAVPLAFRIADDPSLDRLQIFRSILGETTLDSARAEYLDRSGNRDGGLDLGDLRAYSRRLTGDG